jgi:hypothetical protein
MAVVVGGRVDGREEDEVGKVVEGRGTVEGKVEEEGTAAEEEGTAVEERTVEEEEEGTEEGTKEEKVEGREEGREEGGQAAAAEEGILVDCLWAHMAAVGQRVQIGRRNLLIHTRRLRLITASLDSYIIWLMSTRITRNIISNQDAIHKRAM